MTQELHYDSRTWRFCRLIIVPKVSYMAGASHPIIWDGVWQVPSLLLNKDSFDHMSRWMSLDVHVDSCRCGNSQINGESS